MNAILEVQTDFGVVDCTKVNAANFNHKRDVRTRKVGVGVILT